MNEPTHDRRQALGRVALLGAVLLLLVGAHQSGLLATLADRDRASALLADLGVFGPIGYVASFSLLEPFFVPGVVFVLGASAVWPFWTAYALSLAGATGAGLVGFGFARFLARDWVEARLPERFRRFDDELAGPRGFRTVVVVRLLFFIAPPAHWVLGLSRVRFLPFALGTVLGLAPAMLGLTWVCFELADSIRTRGPTFFFAILAAVGVFIAIRWIRRETASRSTAS